MAVRASLACFPSESALHDTCGMPWGVAVTPFSAADERGSPPATGDEGHLLPRCESCFAYFTILCPLSRWSWTCAICSAENDLPADAAARYARDGGHDPPEMRSAFVDLLVPGEEGDVAATTPVYVAAIDLSSSEEFLELVKSALLAALEALSPGSLFGLLTFSSKIGLYDVQGPIPIVKNVFIPPDSDGALHANLEDVMPLCSFLAPIDSCKDCIAEALETIKPMSSWEVAANTSEEHDHVLHQTTRGFGVALDALVNYLSLEYGNAFELARIFAFLSGPPNYGAGQLDTTSYVDRNAGKSGDADHILLQEQTSFYKNLATSAVQAGVCVDLFAITNEYTDLTSLKVLSVESGGSLFLYSSTDESTLPQDIYKMLSCPYAFGCVMRLRTSSQFKIANSYGHFFSDPQYMHVQHINCCDSFATYSYDFEFEKDSRFSSKSSHPILQIAFKYTVLVHHGDTSDVSNSGSRSKYSLQRRLRVRTIQYNTTANIWDLYDFVDPDVVLTILVHQVILASLSDELEARLLLQDWLVVAIAQYNKAYKNVRSGGGTEIYDIDVDFTHCSQLQPLSRFVYAILLSPLLQVNSEGIHPDYRTYLQCLFSALEPASLRQAIWPTLISYSSLDVEAEVHQSLSRTVFTSESPIFLLDAYIDLLVYYSPTAGATIPFPPPRDCLLRSTIDRLKQERNITPKLILIHGAHDDTTALEKYLIEDQILDASQLASSTGFSSYLDEVRSKVAEHGI
ncbi:protein transport protein SEC23 D-like [Phragmites australis]|uniref:protein transport protein SEC23 D-like n=1 Tax=Phragmites australis TaxID=29695 RepID=UPI002D771617|nr:protein transport protein SEC23 D-like [Phragmites australis]